jgi:PKD repeat protein
MKSYAWTFGDGASAKAGPGAKTSHDYSAKGTYNVVVTLVVVDKNGVSGSVSKTISFVNVR